MNTIRVVGIDIAKSVFQVCIWMVNGSISWNIKISRSKLLDTIRQFDLKLLLLWRPAPLSINGGLMPEESENKYRSYHKTVARMT